MTVFLDTDILLDFLGERQPFAVHAGKIFTYAYRKEITVYTSANSITTCYYILNQHTTSKKARVLILDLLGELSIIPITEDILWRGFSSGFQDAEDGVQHFAALSVDTIECIVTRNIKDYRASKLPVYSSEEFVHKYLA
jgi:predicted nucleic acid-binding protein